MSLETKYPSEQINFCQMAYVSRTFAPFLVTIEQDETSSEILAVVNFVSLCNHDLKYSARER